MDNLSIDNKNEQLTAIAKSDAMDNQSNEQSSDATLPWFERIITVLKELGGSATRKEAHERLYEKYGITSEDLSITRGVTKLVKVTHDIDWARQVLVFAGYIDNSVRGRWALTEKGNTSPMNMDIAIAIKRNQVKALRKGEIHYWIYSPGEQARLWDDFRVEGIMGIGWDGIGDLSEYNSKSDIKTALQELFSDNKSHKNDTHALWEFANKVAIGDVIFVKKGSSLVLGRGIVESDYIFDDERDEYKNIREVKWTHSGNWEHPGQAAQKTLTDITSYTDYVEKLEALFRDEEEVEDDKPEIDYDVYAQREFLKDVYISEKRYNTLKSLLLRKKNIILQGS